MRLGSDDQEYLRQIEEDALEAATRLGRVDNAAAVEYLRDRLLTVAAIGHAWAAGVLDEATQAGLLQRLKRRQKAMKVFVKVGGQLRTMPRSYSRNGQLAFWMELSRDELAELVRETASQAAVLNQNAGVMRWALHLMDKHGTETAAAAFAAEGIDPTRVDGIDVPEEWAS